MALSTPRHQARAQGSRPGNRIRTSVTVSAAAHRRTVREHGGDGTGRKHPEQQESTVTAAAGRPRRPPPARPPPPALGEQAAVDRDERGDRTPSPSRFCRTLGIRRAARKASTATLAHHSGDTCSRTSPLTRESRIPPRPGGVRRGWVPTSGSTAVCALRASPVAREPRHALLGPDHQQAITPAASRHARPVQPAATALHRQHLHAVFCFSLSSFSVRPAATPAGGQGVADDLVGLGERGGDDRVRLVRPSAGVSSPAPIRHRLADAPICSSARNSPARCRRPRRRRAAPSAAGRSTGRRTVLAPEPLAHQPRSRNRIAE